MIHPTNNKTLSQKALWHLKVVLGAVLISFFFSLVFQQKLFHKQLGTMILLTFLQLEIFIALGTLFFQSVKEGEPKFKQKMIVRLILFFLLVLVIATLFFIGMYTTLFLVNGNDFSHFFGSLMNMEMKGFFAATLIGFSLGALFFFYTQWAEALKREQKLTQEKLIFQYETLKSQVNPHFLFNSLNSLSSLVRKDPDLSEQYIQKLSTIYRYILENDDKELVPLSAEIEFVRNYFYLQKIRDEEKIELKMELSEIENIQILPVSLQLLVENALKHNAATRKQPLEIVIHFEGLDKIVVRNNLQKKTQLNGSSKIGLKNLKERSRLILNRNIEILETADEFVVKIPVKLISKS
jgi:hypothetical protein